MSRSFFSSIQQILQEADIVVQVLDARFPELTRNQTLERKIKILDKKLVFVLNKSDTTNMTSLKKSKQALEKDGVVIFLSAKKKKGIPRLRKLLSTMASHKKTKIAIVGYPNVGKSSLINALSGRASARTSSRSGFTRGKQFIRLTDNLLLLDSPGIIPFKEKDSFVLALIGAKSPDHLDDVEGVAVKLVAWINEKDPTAIAAVFSVKLKQGKPIDMLTELALLKKKVLKDNQPDLDAIGKQLIAKWQQGQIRC